MTNSEDISGLYARVSGERQVREATIASQLEDLHARAQADGVTIAPELVFVDDGYTGSSLVRPALEKLRDTAATSAIDRLYVHCPDRLARDFAHQILVIDELQRAGVEVVFLNHTVDDSPEGQMLLQMQGVIAQYERAKILERTRRGRRYKASTGVVSVLAGAPYGYRYITKSEGEGRAEYRVMLDEARVVRQIFDWVARERCSLGEVVHRLAQQGMPTRTGLPRWDRRTLARILTNPAYKGTAGWGKTQQAVERKPRLRPRRGQPEFPRRSKGVRSVPPEQWSFIAVPALVDEETFEAAQEQLAHNRAHHGRPAVAGRFLLTGLLVCCRCGRAYTGQTVRSRTARHQGQFYGYYRCCGTEANRFGGQRMCASTAVRTDRLDAALWQDVSGLLLEPGRVEAEYRRRLEQQAGPGELDVASLRTQIGGLKRRIVRLTEMYEEGFLEQQTFRSRMTSAQSRLKSLEDEAAELAARETNASELRLVVGQLEAFAERMRSGLDQCDWATRKSIVQSLVKRIEIGDSDVRVVYKVSPDPFEQTPPQEGGVFRNCGRRAQPRPGRNSSPISG
jgi:site-specific DNA recombinase